ncbi:MAG: hypothetical protein NTY33_04835 [Candidatus Moranbacteria bacterium]|nr:hypothetical protein [Candidatus Moranbacteria bacterium]
MEEKNTNDANKNAEKIQALRDMISTAETTLQGAKSMLLQLEGKKKAGRRRKTEDADENEKVIEGTFDGQIMLGTDGKQYPVPANYASKSKLVKGDMMKLSITSDGSFIYKQIGPVVRKMAIGTVNQDTDGNYFVVADGKAYRVLLASITYFKVEPGDEVTLVTPRDIDSEWGAIENLLQKSREKKELPRKDADQDIGGFRKIDGIFNEKPARDETAAPAAPAPEKEVASTSDNTSVIDEWMPNLDELRKELENKSQE